jgi:peptidoglycan/xylan/chitin deacetylase (PgdA/CDA1 family)
MTIRSYFFDTMSDGVPSGSRGQLLLVPQKHGRPHKFERTTEVPTNVYLTVDTEFSAGGFFHDPRLKPITDRSVYCEIGGRSHGLHFMLETLKEFGLQATFFVEGAHTYVLGFEPMRRPVQEILAAGHDLQLHVHPMWLHGSSRRNGCALTDDMSELSPEQVTEAIQQGLQALEIWGAPRPLVFRPGNLRIGRSVYPVLKRLGIPASSSIGAGSGIPYGNLSFSSGRRWIDGVIEVPVTSYCGLRLGPIRTRHILTIAGASASEIESVINDGSRAGVPDIVIVTHTFEFIKQRSAYYENIAPNRITQRRFRKLCIILAASPCKVTTMGEGAAEWLRSGEHPESELSSRSSATIGRILCNALNNRMWWL